MGAAVPGRMSSDHRDDLMVCPESLCPNLFALSLSKGVWYQAVPLMRFGEAHRGVR